MNLPLLVNLAAGVTLWLGVVAGAMLVLGRYPAVLRRNVCRLGLAGVPVVLAGAAAMHWLNPSAGVLRRPAEPRPTVARAVPPPLHLSAVDSELNPPHEQSAAAPAARGSSALAGIAPPSAPAAQAGLAMSVDWRLAGVSAGLAVSGLCAFVLALRLVRLALWRRTWRPAAPAWVSLTRRLARRTGLERPFSVFIAPGLSQPAAAGVLRPVIVLPDQPRRTLGPGLRGALAHELGHLDGRDPLWNVLGQAAVALAWWCPLAWWICRRARVEGELAADDRALESGVRPVDLARALAHFAESTRNPLPAVISGMACHLRRRIEMIMNVKQPHNSRIGRQSRWLLGLAAGLVAAAVVSLPVVGMARAADEGEGGERVRPREERRERVERDAPREERRGEGERRERDEPIRVRAEGRGEREGDVRGGPRMPRELADMVRELDLTDAQKKAVQDKLEAKEAALRAWRMDNQPKIKTAEDALRKAQAELRDLRDAEQAVAKAGDEQVMSVFTPEQLAQWDTKKVVNTFFRRSGERREPIEFTATQTDHIKALCDEAAKELVAAAKKPPREAAEAKQDILYKLAKKIYGDVLLPEQQAGVSEPEAPRRARGEGEEGEGPRERRPEPRPKRRAEPKDERGIDRGNER